MITDKEISVVVQGNIEERYIYKCIASIRQVMPNAELILSTWKSDRDKTNNLKCDLFVFSDDPGGELLNKKENKLNNINRELVSTMAGIRKATRKYILKIRSNMTVLNLLFLDIYEEKKEGVYNCLLKNKILILNYYSRNPRILPMPLCPSDWIAFGLADDLRLYYDIPLQKKEELLWYKNHRNKSIFFRDVYSLFAPEQHIFINFLKKNNIKIDCKNYYDINRDNLFLYEMLIAMIFVIVDFDLGSFSFLKYNPNRYFEKASLISYKDWCILNNHYEKQRTNIRWYIYCINKWIVHIYYLYMRRGLVKAIKTFKLDMVVKSLLNRR